MMDELENLFGRYNMNGEISMHYETRLYLSDPGSA